MSEKQKRELKLAKEIDKIIGRITKRLVILFILFIILVALLQNGI